MSFLALQLHLQAKWAQDGWRVKVLSSRWSAQHIVLFKILDKLLSHKHLKFIADVIVHPTGAFIILIIIIYHLVLLTPGSGNAYIQAKYMAECKWNS